MYSRRLTASGCIRKYQEHDFRSYMIIHYLFIVFPQLSATVPVTGCLLMGDCACSMACRR